jgi:hypothetical protein
MSEETGELDPKATMEQVNAAKFIEGLHAYLKKEIGPLFARVKKLGEENRELRERGLCYRGVFQRACLPYRRGDVVTFNGNAWICVGEGKGNPGENPGFQLLVKGTRS